MEYWSCLVFFDLETTGLNPKTDEILQIAASGDDATFNIYIEDVPHALEMFVSFLEKLEFCGKLVLVAHNAKFDAGFLVPQLQKHGLLSRFQTRVDGFVDTLKMFRHGFPDLYCYKQIFLVTWFLGDEVEFYEAHNAKSDVEFLSKLFR
jgi:DNA polymerase III subunit alpha, Gram-positive type